MKQSLLALTSFMVWLAMAVTARAADDGAAAIVSRGFVAGDLPTPSCHASTIAETKPGAELLLFYKVGPDPRTWWGLARSSGDGGRTWNEMTLTDLPNPNSGTDAVTLADGRHLVIYNHTEKGRSPLAIAVSTEGRAWTPAVTLETEHGEFSYPAIIQAANGQMHFTYTWNRKRIAHAVIDPGTIPPATARCQPP